MLFWNEPKGYMEMMSKYIFQLIETKSIW